MSKSKSHSVSQSVSQSVTRSPIELSWTAKNWAKRDWVQSFFGYFCISDLTPRQRRIVAFMQINRIWKNKSPWGPDNRRLAEIVKLQVKLFPLSLVITCANQGCSDIAISNSAYPHEIESLPLVLYVEVVWTLIPREACVYLCLSVCACMCVCVWACV